MILASPPFKVGNRSQNDYLVKNNVFMKVMVQAESISKLMQYQLHERVYPSWVFDESTLLIIDANQSAQDFCNYEGNELIGFVSRSFGKTRT